jgi:hypothetical protein
LHSPDQPHHLSLPKILDPQLELIAPKKATALERAAEAAAMGVNEGTSVLLFLAGFFCKAKGMIKPRSVN